MADKPISFSAPMVRALLDGRKTQTRRLLTKSLPPVDADGVRAWFAPPEVPTKGIANQWAESGVWAFRHMDEEDQGNACGGYNRYCGPLPFRPGDRAYVREAWRVHKSFDEMPGSELEALAPRVWPEVDRDNCGAHGRYRHGRFMPRWASRLTLFVEDVRVQRLQDISEDDAVAEGIEARGMGVLWGWIDYLETNPNLTRHFADPRRSYASLWDSLHTEPGTRWEDNPWIYALTFRVARGNIDELAA